jgi:hypothetical protein
MSRLVGRLLWHDENLSRINQRRITDLRGVRLVNRTIMRSPSIEVLAEVPKIVAWYDFRSADFCDNGVG